MSEADLIAPAPEVQIPTEVGHPFQDDVGR